MTIACSLSPADYRRRIADLEAFARAALLDRRPMDRGVRLTFDATARPRLEAFIAAESECCPFLTMDLRPADGRLVLEVTGPDEATPVVAQLLGG